jgi:hypothetical protein
MRGDKPLRVRDKPLRSKKYSRSLGLGLGFGFGRLLDKKIKKNPIIPPTPVPVASTDDGFVPVACTDDGSVPVACTDDGSVPVASTDVGSTLKEGLKHIRKTARDYFLSEDGGVKGISMANQFVKSFLHFLKFAFLLLRKEYGESWSPVPLAKTIRHIIRSRYDLISAYLRQYKTLLKASSIMNKWTH